MMKNEPLLHRVITLPIALTNGNEGRVSKHFGASAKRRKEYETIIGMKYGKLQPPPYKQLVKVIRVLGKGERFFDPDSLSRGNLKEIFDAMTAVGFWTDDLAKWITGVMCEQDDSDRARGPYTKMILYEVGETSYGKLFVQPPDVKLI